MGGGGICVCVTSRRPHNQSAGATMCVCVCMCRLLMPSVPPVRAVHLHLRLCAPRRRAAGLALQTWQARGLAACISRLGLRVRPCRTRPALAACRAAVRRPLKSKASDDDASDAALRPRGAQISRRSGGDAPVQPLPPPPAHPPPPHPPHREGLERRERAPGVLVALLALLGLAAALLLFALSVGSGLALLDAEYREAQVRGGGALQPPPLLCCSHPPLCVRACRAAARAPSSTGAAAAWASGLKAHVPQQAVILHSNYHVQARAHWTMGEGAGGGHITPTRPPTPDPRCCCCCCSPRSP